MVFVMVEVWIRFYGSNSKDWSGIVRTFLEKIGFELSFEGKKKSWLNEEGGRVLNR